MINLRLCVIVFSISIVIHYVTRLSNPVISYLDHNLFVHTGECSCDPELPEETTPICKLIMWWRWPLVSGSLYFGYIWPFLRTTLVYMLHLMPCIIITQWHNFLFSRVWPMPTLNCIRVAPPWWRSFLPGPSCLSEKRRPTVPQRLPTAKQSFPQWYLRRQPSPSSKFIFVWSKSKTATLQ